MHENLNTNIIKWHKLEDNIKKLDAKVKELYPHENIMKKVQNNADNTKAQDTATITHLAEIHN